MINITYWVFLKPKLTSWPIKVILNHPSPYTKVDVSALTLGLTILCADVMTSNCAGGMIVTFVFGSMPPFRIVLTQGTCTKNVSQNISGTPDNVTRQILDTRDDTARTGREIYISLFDPRGYQPAK